MGKPFTLNVVASSRKRALVESLPNLLENKEALKFKSPELAHYVAGLDHNRFYDKEYLKEIKAHMENNKFFFWKRLDVTICIQPRLSLTENGVPQRIREFYNSNPLVHGSGCELVESGSNYKPWVMRCGNSIGAHGIKKAARMIAIIKEHVDPCFDPDGDSPAPPPYVNNRKRKRMQSVNGATSSEDAEVVAVKKRV